MTRLHHLSWENFRATVLVPGQQRVHRVANSPRIEVFCDGVSNRIGLWIEVKAGTSVPPELTRLASITARHMARNGLSFVEVATAVPSLQREFYHFATAVAERVTAERCPPIDAISSELQCFLDLLEQKPLLGIERQIGLLGELIVLERLLERSGQGAVDAWLGPTGEPHDFRLGAVELEVKTTLSPRRIHTIHGLDQLIASKNCALYIVSVLLGPPGDSEGFSLTDKVSQLSDCFAAGSPRMKQFTSALEACGFRQVDSGQYARRYSMRRPLAVVPVNETFPIIARQTIQTALGPLAPRIESLQYEVDVAGLEFEEGTKGFEEAIPTK